MHKRVALRILELAAATDTCAAAPVHNTVQCTFGVLERSPEVTSRHAKDLNLKDRGFGSSAWSYSRCPPSLSRATAVRPELTE